MGTKTVKKNASNEMRDIIGMLELHSYGEVARLVEWLVEEESSGKACNKVLKELDDRIDQLYMSEWLYSKICNHLLERATIILSENPAIIGEGDSLLIEVKPNTASASSIIELTATFGESAFHGWFTFTHLS